MEELELLGGQLVPQKSFEAITQMPSNRTLLVQQLSTKPTKPEPVMGLKTIKEVFQHFSPSVKVDFETEEGKTINEELRFTNIKDFGKEGLMEQSSFLGEIKSEQEAYQKISKKLKTNKILKAAIQNADSRKAFLQALQSVIDELDNAKQN